MTQDEEAAWRSHVAKFEMLAKQAEEAWRSHAAEFDAREEEAWRLYADDGGDFPDRHRYCPDQRSFKAGYLAAGRYFLGEDRCQRPSE